MAASVARFAALNPLRARESRHRVSAMSILIRGSVGSAGQNFRPLSRAQEVAKYSPSGISELDWATHVHIAGPAVNLWQKVSKSPGIPPERRLRDQFVRFRLHGSI
jgi:hypothetical protein